MLNELEKIDEHCAVSQRFKLVNEYCGAASKQLGHGSPARPFPSRLLRDLKNLESAQNWRVKKTQKTITTIDKNRGNYWPMVRRQDR